MTEHVLNYDHSPGVEVQSTYYWCGPTSTEIVLNGRGVIMSQQDLANELGTTVDGTASVEKVAPVLNNHLPGADYRVVLIENDPPTDQQKEALWADLVGSVNAGYGTVVNICVPPSNYPIGVKGSQTPAYSSSRPDGLVFHYIAAMGYDDDPGLRAVWIADPGFRPFGYWVALDQLITMIPPKGYTAAHPTTSWEAFMATNQEKLDAIWNKMCAYPDSPDIAGKWQSRARYATNPGVGVDDTVGMVLYTDANLYDLYVEFAATQGHKPSQDLIKQRAKDHPDDERAVFFASKF